MSLLLAAALAVAPATLPACSWDRPGANPFVGDVVAAVDRYTDIPPAVRKALQARMTARQYDEIASISRDAISGQQRYRPEIRDMHFGDGTVCKTVTRKKWPEAAVERGLVYCESGHCVIVPTVCRNVSRVTRLPARVAAAADMAPARLASAEDAAGGAGGEGPGGRASARAAAGDGELLFDSPGAGSSFAQRASTSAPADAGAGFAPAGTAGLGDAFGPGPATGSGTFGAGASATAPGAVAGTGGALGGATPGGAAADGGPAVLGTSPLALGGGGGGGGGGIAPRVVETAAAPVPEPGTWALMSLGVLAVFAAARRRRR